MPSCSCRRPPPAQTATAFPLLEARLADFRVVYTRTGKELTLPRLADELAENEVVSLSELHDNAAGHRMSPLGPSWWSVGRTR